MSELTMARVMEALHRHPDGNYPRNVVIVHDADWLPFLRDLPQDRLYIYVNVFLGTLCGADVYTVDDMIKLHGVLTDIEGDCMFLRDTSGVKTITGGKPKRWGGCQCTSF